MPSPIQSSGFGLNFSQGFGRRAGGVIDSGLSSTLPAFAQGAVQNYLQRPRLAQEQNQFNATLAQQDKALGQREADAQRQFNLGMSQMGAQRDAARQATETARLGQAQTQGRFNAGYDLVTKQLAQAGNWMGGYRGNGPQGNQPAISDAPVYNEQQIQQQVNAQRAANDQSLAGRLRESQSQLAGRGFGSRSPLSMALEQGFANANLAQNTANERDLRLGAATANSNQVLKAQTAREQQYASRQQEDIERGKAYSGMINPLISALLGAV